MKTIPQYFSTIFLLQFFSSLLLSDWVFFWWFEIKSITSSHSQWWIIQILHAHYTHIFTEQYDDHDDFPIQSKQGECYKFWDTKALYTIYITSTHIFNISLGRCLCGVLCNVDIYIFFYQGRWMKKKRRKKKIHGCSSLHTKLIIFEVSVCYNQRSIFTGIRTRKEKEREREKKLGEVCLHTLYTCIISAICLSEVMAFIDVRMMRPFEKGRGHQSIYLFLCFIFNDHHHIEHKHNNER